MKVFTFQITQLKHIIHGLRKLREAEPENAPAIDGTLCWLKNQMVGLIQHTEPFMRNRKWITDEIAYEKAPHVTEFHDCRNDQCKKPCRGKFCATCWEAILAEIHDEKEHEQVECKKV